MFFGINDVDIRKACMSPKMRLLSKLLVTLQPQWAPFVENMQSTQLKVKKQPFSFLAPQEPGSVLLRSQLAPQEQGRCSSGALAPEEPGSVLLRSPVRVGAPEEPGSVLLRSRSQGRLLSGAAISHHPLPGPAPAMPLPPVTPADLLRINDCIPQTPVSKIQKYRKCNPPSTLNSNQIPQIQQEPNPQSNPHCGLPFSTPIVSRWWACTRFAPRRKALKLAYEHK